uniref:Protein kinase domain-containing protein n=1 Tax=Physcomitrium patens TaxID=3218 RepID=A0A7I4BEG5_PHYPA
MAVFGMKLVCAFVMLDIMTKVCHAASPTGFCNSTCGRITLKYPFRLMDNENPAKCYSNYPQLKFLCPDETLRLHFTSMPEYSENEYLVLDINYENLTLSIVPSNGACYLFNTSSFGGMNIKNTSMLYLNCRTEIGGSCEPANKTSSTCGINPAGNTQPSTWFSCPVKLQQDSDQKYKECFLTDPLQLQFTNDNRTSIPVPSPSPSPSNTPPAANSNKSNLNVFIILGVVGGFLAAVLIFLCALLYCCRRSRPGPSDLVKFDSGDKKAFEKIRSGGSGHIPQLFTYKELDHATQNFSANHQLGEGGFGTVYKGKLSDGRLVAVKKLNQGGSQGIQQFHNEVEVLSKVRHPHLVQLLGWCRERPLLVYEYLPNGSISYHLHGGNNGHLPWETRLGIAIQTAEALSYLHFVVSPPIFHRDVKTTNILLDEGFKVKVADFGLSRLVVNLENTHISTAPQGTPGYLDPDYHESYHLSDKSDVYSFGVVLMELVTAKKAVDMARERKEINLASLAVAKIHSGCLHEILDPNLTVQFHDNPMMQVMVEQVAELAFRCLASEKDDRPSMKEVLAELLRIHIVGIDFHPSVKKLEMDPSYHNEDSAKPLVKKDGGWRASPTSVQDVWVSNTTSPADSLAEIA